jgi:hypothetical protein
VQDKDGKPANDLEPYMELAGHAEFVSNDLSVFPHVRPAGSVSMAALESARGSTEVAAGMPMAKLVAPSCKGPSGRGLVEGCICI